MIISGYTVYQMLFLELKATERKKKTKLLINKCNPFFPPTPTYIFLNFKSSIKHYKGQTTFLQ